MPLDGPYICLWVHNREVKSAEIVWIIIRTKPCLIIEPKRERNSVSDLERTITGLPLFEQRSPLQKPVLGHFGTLQIVFQKKKKHRNVIPPHAKLF